MARSQSCVADQDQETMILNIRNQIDFLLRRVIRFRRPIADDVSVPHIDSLLQKEFREFLDLLGLETFIGPDQTIRVADVGCRTFVYAPVIDTWLEHAGIACELHGIEVDAWRRFSELRCRADYGEYYARRVRSGFYQAMNFLDWQRELDLVFLLNPFVEEAPLLKWGLPRSEFRPELIFSQAYQTLASRQGTLILSSPTTDELSVALAYAKAAGFNLLHQASWHASQDTTHQQDRLGAVLKT